MTKRRRKKRKVQQDEQAARYGAIRRYLVTSAGDFRVQNAQGQQFKAHLSREMIGTEMEFRQAVAEPLVVGGLLLPVEH